MLRRFARATGGLGGAVVIGLVVVLLSSATAIGSKHSLHRLTVSAAVPGRQQLIDILGVLRRPQTKADLSLKLLSPGHPGFGAFVGSVDLPLVRLATVTPWGEKLFFVPSKPRRSQIMARRGSHGETLGVFSNNGGGSGATAADIEARGSLETDGAGRSFAGGSTQTRLILVVPDGVARVVFVVPRQSAGVGYGAPIYKHSLKVAVSVHGNVAAVQIRRECCNGQPPMIWYAADGHVTKRIGNFSSINRVIPPPQPGPQTPLSRAAERNPSTPNPVWVTPTTGRSHTTFRVHFRVLLNDADYRYTFSGPRCPQFTFPGGTGGGPNDLRGDLWSDPLTAVQGQALCPGTYHVSVTVMDLGRNGNLKHPARPFGTASYTVRP